jgi:uncharacterized cupredoxin-like copper-binding protein/Cu/Ag efflux protein CusF
MMKSMTSSALIAAIAVSSLAVSASRPAHAHGSQHHAHATKNSDQIEQKDWGIAGDAKRATRTVEVRMSDDMRFSPDRIDVQLNETVRFRVQNTGKLMHEFVIGTKAENAKHAELMIKFPNMEHDEPYMAHVGPGKTGEIVWTFNRAGDFEFACLIAGHFQAGMVGVISVAQAGASPSHGSHGAHSSHGAQLGPVAQASTSDLADGEVRKIDKEAGKLTLRHGEIKSLDMPPMTMVFQVKDVALLDKLKPGDKVKFSVEKSGGVYVVTSIEIAR